MTGKGSPRGTPSESSERTETCADIYAQGDSLRETLEVLESKPVHVGALARKRRFVFTGCGSSYYAGRCAAALLRNLTGADARAVPASELWLLPGADISSETLVVGISRTGTTTEVVRVLEVAQDRGAATLAISIGARPETFDFADHRVWLPHAAERSPVMTQSFSNLLFAAQHTSVEISRGLDGAQAEGYANGLRRVPGLVADELEYLDTAARELATDVPDYVVFLGSGSHEGLCAEAALKVQEMTRLPVGSHPPLEFRHGPIASLTPDSLVVVLSTPMSRPFDEIVFADAGLLGVKAVDVAPDYVRSAASAASVRVPDPGVEWLVGNVSLPFFQFLAHHLTVKLGQAPESVRHLDRKKNPHLDPHVVDLDLNLRPTVEHKG